ncbi:MAG: phosphoglycerate dehydrogenase [Hyphomonadaceae bacterium]
MKHPTRRIVITQRFFGEEAIAYLEARGCEAVIAPLAPGKGDGDFSEDELAALLAGAAGWIVGHAHVTRALLARLPQLQIVSRRGVGFERVDVAAVRDLGKVACIAVGGNDASVADHTLALMLAVGHRLRETQANMQAGNWSILLGNDLYRRTVGVIGLGRIGRAVVQRLRGFEAEVLVLNATRDEAYAAQQGIAYADLDALLAKSDYVTIHAPLTPATRHIIGEAALARMKPTAFLINTARGGLVDDRALLAALEGKQIAGAALDVFESESDSTLRAVTNALIALPNVIATPHAGASSHEGLARTNMIAARNVVAVIEGASPPEACVVADGRAREAIAS